MATANSTGEIPSYQDFASKVTHDIYELSYQIKATNALLMQFENYEGINELVGVDYLLQGIAERCDQLAADITDADHLYVAKEVSRG